MPKQGLYANIQQKEKADRRWIWRKDAQAWITRRTDSAGF